MTNRPKQIGTSFESLLVKGLTDSGYDAERQVLHGNKDEGDIRVRQGRGQDFNIEAKCVKATSLGTWVDESRVEAEHAGRPCIVVHKRRGKGQAMDQFVTMRLGDFLAWFAPVDPSVFGDS